MYAIALKNKRLVVALLFATIIASIFWSQSRIPALNEKAQMGLRTNFGEIAFEILLPVSSEQAFYERVARSSVNWAYTNMQGMLFGLLFAAAVLTILSSIKSRSFRHPWLNTLSGVLVGAPLGVCVNCATPIAYGIYSAGARLETALASLFASPTLNAIVLTMTFTLLPWEMALFKLFGVLMLLISIPLLVKHIPIVIDPKVVAAVPKGSFGSRFSTLQSQPDYNVDENYFVAILVTARSFISHLLYIIKFALPLMLLAGLLGALVLELVPFSLFANTDPSLMILLLCAVVATALPVPIAFDVIIVMALIANGIDKGLATVLLFGLGIFSIYPAFVIARYISVRLSLAIAVLVMVISCVLGLVAQNYFEYKSRSEEVVIAKGLTQSAESIYTEAIQICESLPKQLQSICFEQHIQQFDDTVSYETMCKIRPSGLEYAICEEKVNAFVTRQKALAKNNTDICHEIDNTDLRHECNYYVVVKSALKEHDIEVCNKLSHPNAVVACRDKYLNTSLLFNPDDSVCKGLSGKELDYCRINADIYWLAEVMDIEQCNNFEAEGAREHCRYTVASVMIGRSNDSSGCSKLRSSVLAERCESLTTAWKATKENNPALCRELNSEDLSDLCLLKVADKQIQSVLVKHALVSSGDTSMVFADPRKLFSVNQQTITDAPLVKWSQVFANDETEIFFSPHNKLSSKSEKIFQKLSGQELGISKSWQFRPTDFFEPFIIGKGIASGDFNNDLWPDIVLATEQGILIYQNIGGRFELVPVNQGDMQYSNLFLVAFVDVDNDGLQDIFASSYGGRNFILKNVGGSFEQAVLEIHDGDHRLTMSAGFGDLNQDGLLDIVLGNWSSGVEKLFSPEDSENVIMFRDGDVYRTEVLTEVKGESNSILLADINDDYLTDLVIGNDRLVPDMFYLNSGKGKFELISRNSGVVPLSTMFTMSIDAADFNNDLKFDLFSTDMTFSRSSRENYCASIKNPDDRKHCDDTLIRYRSFQEGSAVTCNQLSEPHERQECYITFSVKAAKELKSPDFCESLPDKNTVIFSLCQHISLPVPPEESLDKNLFIPQVQRNTLLMGSNNKFIESAENYGVGSSYWSWNAKAADLDSDGWQDIYVGNGFHFGDSFYEIQENILFHNVNGDHFEQVQSEWGLNDSINTPSYTYLDLDLDGDLDIIATGVLAPPRVYLNQNNKNASIMFSLIDEQGNSSGIGAQVTIKYGGEKALSQRKENKLSSGFLSFDNPVLHFGLGEYAIVDEVEIRWTDGGVTVYSQPLAANGIYRVRRLESPDITH